MRRVAPKAIISADSLTMLFVDGAFCADYPSVTQTNVLTVKTIAK
jgi:hypothetical protein